MHPPLAIWLRRSWINPSPEPEAVLEGPKKVTVAQAAGSTSRSPAGDIDLLVATCTTNANSNKTKSVPALVAASIAAGAWWVVLS